MENIGGQRLKEKRLEKGYSLAHLGKLVGVSASAILKWERNGVANQRSENIFKLASVLNVSAAYLLGIDEDSPMNAKNIEPLPKMIHVPLVGTIACGDPILAQENIEDWVAVDGNFKVNFALRCKGDSMILARIYDGDLVFIKQQPIVNNGEIAAVLIDNEATLKRFYRFPDHIELRPENPNYETLVFSPEEAEQIRILGKAVIFTGRVR